MVMTGSPTAIIAVAVSEAAPKESTTLKAKLPEPLKEVAGSNTRFAMSDFETVFGRSPLGIAVPLSLSVPAAPAGRRVIWISFSGSFSTTYVGWSVGLPVSA